MGSVHAPLACVSKYVCFAFLSSDRQGPLLSAMEKALEDVSTLAHIAYVLIKKCLFVEQESAFSWG